MNIQEIKELIREVLQSDISEFELEHAGTRVRLKRGFGSNTPAISTSATSAFANSSSTQPANSELFSSPAGTTAGSDEAGLHIITSPIVGTVYRSSSPETGPYVNPGDHIHEGAILCLVEAMKLMNEIPSDVEGEIARIYVENGAPVEFGQKLFGIRPQKKS
jgi:acetyl-CoA carboxylase biotin carboxyl carrier protein